MSGNPTTEWQPGEKEAWWDWMVNQVGEAGARDAAGRAKRRIPSGGPAILPHLIAATQEVAQEQACTPRSGTKPRC